MTRIQSNGLVGSKDELIVLHNNTGTEVDITNWCVMNKNADAFACFTSHRTDVIERYILPAYSDAVIVSDGYVSGSGYPPGDYVLEYAVKNQSTGSIINSSDMILLIDGKGELVDEMSWNTLIAANKVFSRNKLSLNPDIYVTSNGVADWIIEPRTAPPVSSIQVRATPLPDPNTDPGTENPSDDETPPNETEVPQVPQSQELFITELLANPSGSDTSKEYIELYNPINAIVDLSHYSLAVGTDNPKTYTFPAGSSIPPLSYAIFTNSDMGFTLVNTNGKIQLLKDGTQLGAAVEYADSKDNAAWALIGDTWQYTLTMTPGGENLITTPTVQEKADEESTPKPCAANQFRNPETGRCKLLSSAESILAACKEGQERNIETNRCRSTVVATTTPAPCKEGQERNSETNRCRTIVKMSDAGFGAKGVKTSEAAAVQWYYWVTISVVVLLILAYAVWEWRQELLALGGKIKKRLFARRAN
jgi:hypothetical protein